MSYLKRGRVVVSFTKSNNSRLAFAALFPHKCEDYITCDITFIQMQYQSQHPVVPNPHITA